MITQKPITLCICKFQYTSLSYPNFESNIDFFPKVLNT